MRPEREGLASDPPAAHQNRHATRDAPSHCVNIIPALAFVTPIIPASQCSYRVPHHGRRREQLLRYGNCSQSSRPSTYEPRLDPIHIAVIGGTGLQSLPGFTHVASLSPDTPWGKASSPISVLHHPSPSNGKPIPVAFISRHGLHHEIAPHEIPARANIAALRSLGVRTIIAFSAVGSLQEDIKPRDFVIPDQIIDRTKGIRPFTFFEKGMVGHVGFADPFDAGLAKVVSVCGHSLAGEGVRLHDKGTIVCMGMAV